MTRIVPSIWPSFEAFLISAGILMLFLHGCAFTNILPHAGRSLPPTGSLSVTQYELTIAVWLEDQCETQETDEQHLTMIEALHDGLVYPGEALVAVAAVTVIGTVWSLYDRVVLPAGEPLPNRPQTVMEYVKPHRAAPQYPSHSKSHGPDIPIAWLGCLSAHGDG